MERPDGKLLSKYGCWTKNRGIFPPKWMVYFMENPIQINDFVGTHPYFWKHPYTYRIL